MRVLIADDEAVIRLDLHEMLLEMGHEVVGSVGSGTEAVEQARRLLPDIVIMDIKMPGISGISAAEALQEEGIGPIILLTAFSDRYLIDKASRAGVYSYVVKPFSEGEIDSAISISVARYHEALALKAQATELYQGLQERKLIERAKGVIMRINGIPEDAAFDYIRKRSRTSGKGMSEVAADILKRNTGK